MSSKGWLIPEPIEGNDEICLTITIPDNRRYIAAVVGAIYQTGKWFNWQTTGEIGDTRASETAAVMRRYIYDTLKVGDCPVRLSETEDQRSQSVFSGFSAIDDLLELMEQINVKYRIDGKLYEPVIDLVECGCGSGSDGTEGASAGGGIVPGGSEGGNYEGLTRVIDICKNVRTIFLDQIDDWIDSAQLLQYVPGLNFLSEGLEEVLAVSLDELDAFEGESGSADFEDAFKKWVVQRFDDPFPGFVDREQLRTLTARLPLTSGGTLFMPVVRVWAETADIQRLNASIKAAKGTASLSGECAALQRGFGREPYQPTGGDGTVELIDETSGFKYTRVASEIFLGNAAGTDIQISGENFVGVIVGGLIVEEDVAIGTITDINAQINLPTTGTINNQIGVGSGDIMAGQTFLRSCGKSDMLQVAKNFSSSYFPNADFEGQVDSGLAVIPEPGEFTGTISWQNNTNGSANVELSDGSVWVITGI